VVLVLEKLKELEKEIKSQKEQYRNVQKNCQDRSSKSELFYKMDDRETNYPLTLPTLALPRSGYKGLSQPKLPL